MDIASLVKILSPALPVLFGLATKAGENGSEILAEKGAERIWEKLFPKLKEKPAALEAASDVAKNPEDEDAQAFLRVQLKKILSDTQNADLANEITQILQEESAHKPSKYNINAQGSSVGIMGDHGKIDQVNFGQLANE